MSLRAMKSRPAARFSAACIFALTLCAANAGAQAADGPFANLPGHWAGSGTILGANGNRERISCRGTYSVSPSGMNLNQTLRCASDSFKLEITSALVYEGGTIGGQWTESTRNATGNVSGRASANEIVGTISGPGFSAGLSVNTRGDNQSLTIRPQGGTDIREVSITMKRS